MLLRAPLHKSEVIYSWLSLSVCKDGLNSKAAAIAKLLYGVDAASFAATEPTPVCDHYVSYLLRIAAIADLPEAIAALLPCFWVYLRVG